MNKICQNNEFESDSDVEEKETYDGKGALLIDQYDHTIIDGELVLASLRGNRKSGSHEEKDENEFSIILDLQEETIQIDDYDTRKIVSF